MCVSVEVGQGDFNLSFIKIIKLLIPLPSLPVHVVDERNIHEKAREKEKEEKY